MFAFASIRRYIGVFKITDIGLLKKPAFMALVVFGLAATAACTGSRTGSRTGGWTSGWSSRRFSANEEAQASSATFQWLRDRYGVLTEPQLTQLLDRVATRLARGISSPSAHRFITSSRDLRGRWPAGRSVPYPVIESINGAWQVFVIDTPEPNAFSLGSGVVVITRGMLLSVPSESALATVLSHEFAHQLLGHTSDALRSSAEAGAQAGVDSEDAAKQPHAAFSLEQELQADSLGVQLLYLAGYNVGHAMSSLTIAYDKYRPESAKVSADISSDNPGWLTSRVANLQSQIRALPNLPATETTREFNRVVRSVQMRS